ncbi:MAG: CHAT domain-containing protein [Rhizobiaceae bacterium]
MNWTKVCAGRAAAAAIIVLAALTAGPSRAQQSEPVPAQAAELSPAETVFETRIRAAYRLMTQQDGFDEGYRQLRSALTDLARTDLFAYTVKKYTEGGTIFHQNGFIQEADEIFTEGEQIRAMQQDVKERADFFLAFAEFKVYARDFARIVPLYTTAARYYAEYYGNESREVLNATDLLAGAIGNAGQLGTAANLQQGNYDIALKNLGPDDPLTWRLANNLADTFRGLGAPTRALQLDLMLLQKRTAQYGRDHFNVLVSANNTAQDYLDLGDHAGAMRNFELNRQIAAALHQQDPGWEVQANTWLQYTQLFFGKAGFDAATVAELDGVIANPGYPALLNYRIARLLAAHFAETGEAARSMKYLEKALAIANGAMSPFHPMTFETRREIANAQASAEPARAAAEYAKLESQMLLWLSEQVMFTGSRVVGEATRALADDMLYDYARLAEKNPQMVPAFADAARRWPTLAHKSRENLRKLMRLVDPDDDETMAILRQALHVSRAMQELYASGSEPELANTLLSQAQSFDKPLNERLAARYPEIRQETLDRPLPPPRDLLGEDQAQVAYFITRKWKPDRESEQPFADVRLYAIVSRGGRDPTIHYLGDPRAITAQQPTMQMAMLRSTRPAERGAVPISELDPVFSDLYGSLFAPLEADLAGVGTVFIVPDGQLFAVPFSLLKDGQDRLLEERFTLRLMTSPDSLYGIVTADETLPRNGRATLAGGIDYSNGVERGADPLPGTLQEVESIATLLRSDAFTVDTLTGGAVSETALKQDMEAASIAHLATHGAYASARNGGAANVDTLWQSEVILSKSGDRRAMARDDKDGRLYAFEVMMWDLSRLDLLVLSACDTGRGEETFVGGLRGLPTAISIAGARRSLLTLWPVADEGTAHFMARFYEHLVAGMTYSGALRQTRRDAIDGKVSGASSPLVWAAFVMFEN